MIKTERALLLIAVLGLLCSSPLGVKAARLHASRLIGAGWPEAPARLKTVMNAWDGRVEAEVDKGEAERIEQIKAEISRFWEIPTSWEIAQAQAGDLNQDGQMEYSLLVWRAFEPWPIDRYLPHGGRLHGFHDAAGLSCHLILLGWQGGRFGELWAGSALAAPLLDFTVGDLDGDGDEELLALEGRYTDPGRSKAWALSAWEWNGFGFSLVDRVLGNFDWVAVVATGRGENWVLFSR